MKLITIFNFPDEENYNNLCRWWLKQALENTDLPIEIWHSNNIDHLDFEEMPNRQVSIINKDTLDLSDKIHSSLISDKSKHNVGFKLYNLCNEVQPFIFVDADAIIFKNLNSLVEASRRKPFIAVDHQDIPSHTSHIPEKFLNSGVQVCSDPSLLNLEDIIHYLNLHNKFLVPGTDQSMLWTYFKHLQYDYTDYEIDWRWNNCAGFCDNFEDICINHYWYKFKPWVLNCPKWKEFIKTT
jgi:hypothetical protein